LFLRRLFSVGPMFALGLSRKESLEEPLKFIAYIIGACVHNCSVAADWTMKDITSLEFYYTTNAEDVTTCQPN
jgi:hypothetical protein